MQELCENVVRSIFVRSSGGRAVQNVRQYAMPLRNFLSSAAAEGHLDRHPAAFSCAIARICELVPGDSTTLRLRAPPAGPSSASVAIKPAAEKAGDPSGPGSGSGSGATGAAPSSGGGSQGSKRSSLVPAKRNGDGKVKHRSSDATSSEACAREGSSSSAGDASTDGSPQLPPAFTQTITAVVRKLADAYSACISDTNKTAGKSSSKPVDARRRLLENAWCMHEQNAPQFRVALALHVLVQFILRYSAALPAIMAASAELQLPPAAEGGASTSGGASSPGAPPLLDLVLFRLPPAVVGLTGMPALFSPLLMNSMVRFASAVNMRSAELGSTLVSLVFAEMKEYRAALEASPPAGKISSKCAFMPVADAAVASRLHVFTELLHALTSSGATPWAASTSRSTARLMRDGGAVETLPQILETVNFGSRPGGESALRLLAVVAGAVHVDQKGLSRIRAFIQQQVLQGPRFAGATLQRLHEQGQGMLRSSALLAGLDAASSTPSVAVAAAEFAANMHMSVSTSNADLATLHPYFLRGMLMHGARSNSRGTSSIISLMRDALGGVAGGGPRSMWMSHPAQPLPDAHDEQAFDEEEEQEAFTAAVQREMAGGGGAAALDEDFEEHRTYIDSVLEDADQHGEGEPPEYPARDPAEEEEEEDADMDLDAGEVAGGELSDGHDSQEGHDNDVVGSSEGEEAEDYPDPDGAALRGFLLFWFVFVPPAISCCEE